MKFIFVLAVSLFSQSMLSQVGIHTDTPKAIFHVGTAANTPFKGIIIPVISSAEAYNMPLTNDQNTMLVYIQDGGKNTYYDKMKYVYYPGYYYWSQNYWMPLASPLMQMKGSAQNDEYSSAFRLFKNANSPNFGPLGNNAVDLSYAYTSSGRGATGNNSFATGIMNTSSGERSSVFGGFNTASGSNSMSWGGNLISQIGNTASGSNSTAWGLQTQAIGVLSTAFGNKTRAYSGYETALGAYNTSYLPVNEIYDNQFTEAYNNSNRLLVIGNGTIGASSDALTLLKNGKVGIGINNFETTTSDSKVQVKGSIKLSAENPTLGNNTCNTANLGKIIFVEDNFYGCKSTGWVLLNS
ncbi:hypothetical protein [Chryseobacterium sp.]|uniref:hypothetical protein n=1 Tax=Chryseobacterium sp. TaxID=1871047 RepID=UPI0025BE9CBE|nr:hypothetical protein [Chryseobacterium sp.]MBV8326620.1 hypothetical protein [Chryseobacterium sp.]